MERNPTMTVSDSDRFAIAMAKLSQARNAVYEATRIIEHLFEADGSGPAIAVLRNCVVPEPVLDSGDPVGGLYPGQLPEITQACEEPAVEDIVECVE
jgi:hypothetical protein